MKLTQEDVRELLECDPTTGLFFWKVREPKWFNDTKKRPKEDTCRMWNTKFAGKPAMNISGRDGYFRGTILQKRYLAHRILWLWVHGEEPECIDHINGIRTDNRLENLRNVTNKENKKNVRIQSNNTSGATGVVWFKRDSCWRVQLTISGKVTHIGYYKTFEEAVFARKQAEERNGYHKNHGTEKPTYAR